MILSDYLMHIKYLNIREHTLFYNILETIFHKFQILVIIAILVPYLSMLDPDAPTKWGKERWIATNLQKPLLNYGWQLLLSLVVKIGLQNIMEIRTLKPVQLFKSKLSNFQTYRNLNFEHLIFWKLNKNKFHNFVQLIKDDESEAEFRRSKIFISIMALSFNWRTIQHILIFQCKNRTHSHFWVQKTKSRGNLVGYFENMGPKTRFQKVVYEP